MKMFTSLRGIGVGGHLWIAEGDDLLGMILSDLFHDCILLFLCNHRIQYIKSNKTDNKGLFPHIYSDSFGCNPDGLVV